MGCSICADSIHAKGLCKSHYTKARYAANAERERQRSKDKYRQNNAYYKAYREANAERIRQQSAEWKAANPERVRELNRRWVEENKEHLTQYHADYRVSERGKLLRRASENIRRARKRNAPGLCNADQLQARIDYYGGSCYLCGGIATSIDHVIPLANGGSNWPANLRPACASCNSRKRTKSLSQVA